MQSIDSKLFNDIRVPLAREYHRLSNSPNRDVPTDDSFFKNTVRLEPTDTPVKMKIAEMEKDAEYLDVAASTNENFLNNSEEAAEVQKPVDATKTDAIKAPASRAPLKIAPSNETENLDDIAKFSMFVPKVDPVRLGQRRRSERPPSEGSEKAIPASKEPTKPASRSNSVDPAARGKIPVARSRTPSVVRARTPSVVRARTPSVVRARTPSVVRARTPSVTRPQPIDQSVSEGPQTRSRARAAATATAASFSAPRPNRASALRGSGIGSVNEVEKKLEGLSIISPSGRESRDRTRRSNTTSTTVPKMTGKIGRSNSATRPIAKPAATRPVALARRSIFTSNPTKNAERVPPKPQEIAPTLEEKAEIADTPVVKADKPVVKDPVPPPRNRRGPLRVAADKVDVALPTTTAIKKPVAQVSRAPLLMLNHGATPSKIRQSAHVTKKPETQNNLAPSGKSPNDASKKGTSHRVDLTALVNRLSTPKNVHPPVVRRSLNRPSNNPAAGRGVPPQKNAPLANVEQKGTTPKKVPAYIRSARSNGFPTPAGSHGLRQTQKPRILSADDE